MALKEEGEQMRYCVTIFQIFGPYPALTNAFNGSTSVIWEH